MKMSFLPGFVCGLAVSAGVAVAAPRLDTAWALLGEAQQESAGLRALAQQVPHPHLRRALEDGLYRLDQDLVAMQQLVMTTPVRPAPPTSPMPVWPQQPTWGQPAAWQPAPAPVPDANTFASLLAAVDRTPFADEKLAVLGSISRGRSFTVYQVVQLVNEMPFADTKVEAAVMLYPLVVDVQNWYLVYDTIPFSSSRDELRRRTS